VLEPKHGAIFGHIEIWPTFEMVVLKINGPLTISHSETSHVNMLRLLDPCSICHTDALILGISTRWEILTSVVMVCISNILAQSYDPGDLILDDHFPETFDGVRHGALGSYD
jgi:hypothetical protein